VPIWLNSGNLNGERPELYREGIVRVVRRRMSGDRELHLADGLAMVNDPLFLVVTDHVHSKDAGIIVLPKASPPR
jgi:hypothetical protein